MKDYTHLFLSKVVLKLVVIIFLFSLIFHNFGSQYPQTAQNDSHDMRSDIVGNIISRAERIRSDKSAYISSNKLEQNQWNLIGPWGGTVVSILFSPNNSIFALTHCRARMTGDLMLIMLNPIYKSSDLGASWTRFIDDANCLVFNPYNQNTIFAGCWDGIYKTVDGGNTWQRVGLPWIEIISLAIDPVDTLILYAGGNGMTGIYKTTNGGNSWIPQSNGLSLPTYINDIKIDPSSHNNIFIALGQESGGSNGVFKSTNGGANWHQLGVGQLPNVVVNRVIIDTLTSPMTFYITMGCLWGAQQGGVFKSTDNGNNWINCNAGLTNLYVWHLCVSLTSSDTLYCATDGGGIFKSTNRGNSWFSINNGIPGDMKKAQVVTALRLGSVSAILSGFETIGLYRSINAGQQWTESNAGLSVHGVTNVIVDYNDPRIIYASVCDWNSGGIYKSTDAGNNWQYLTSLPNQRIFSFATCPFNSQILYAGLEGPGNIAPAGIYKTTNGGNTWTYKGLQYDLPYYLTTTSVAPGLIYVGVKDWYSQEAEIIRSTDGGDSWSELFTLSGFCCNSVAVNPFNGNTIFASIPHPGIFKTINGGASWSNCFSNVRPLCLTINPLDTSEIFIGLSAYPNRGGIYHSTNSGLSWNLLAFPGVDITSILIHPNSADTIYVSGFNGSICGVFRSTDHGATWSSMNAGLTWMYLNCLKFDPTTTSRIYAGTAGSGVFRYEAQVSLLENKPTPKVETNIILSISPNPVKSQTTIRYLLLFQETSSLLLYNVSGQLVKTLMNSKKFQELIRVT